MRLAPGSRRAACCVRVPESALAVPCAPLPRAQVNHMLGARSGQFSYVVGYGPASPRRPQHRLASCGGSSGAGAACSVAAGLLAQRPNPVELTGGRCVRGGQYDGGRVVLACLLISMTLIPPHAPLCPLARAQAPWCLALPQTGRLRTTARPVPSPLWACTTTCRSSGCWVGCWHPGLRRASAQQGTGCTSCTQSRACLDAPRARLGHACMGLLSFLVPPESGFYTSHLSIRVLLSVRLWCAACGAFVWLSVEMWANSCRDVVHLQLLQRSVDERC
jgi:hypothetical protein